MFLEKEDPGQLEKRESQVIAPIVNKILDANVEKTDIAVRMPDGSRTNSQFAVEDKLFSLQAFISHSLGKPSSSFDILTSYPLKKIENLDVTFKELGLFPRALVNVQLK